MLPPMDGSSREDLVDLADRRLIALYLPNDWCAFEAILDPILLRCVEHAASCHIAAARPAPVLLDLARESPERVWLPDETTAPPLRSRFDEVAPRMGYVEKCILEDDFVRHLPLPGSAKSGVGHFHWDRLQWCLADRDLTLFAESLPWEESDALLLLGGASDDALAGLALGIARARGLEVIALVPGPTLGRHAPYWIHGCDRVWVADRDAAEALAAAGSPPRTGLDARLAPPSALSPLALDAEAPRVVHVDLRMRTSVRLVRRVVEDWLPGVRRGISALHVHFEGPYLDNLRSHFRDAVAGVPIEYDREPVLARAARGNADVLSFEPWAVAHAGSLLPPTRVGVLGSEVRACLGTVPERLHPYTLEAR